MILTKAQEQGLEIAIERYKRGEKYTVISGYAGSGKSTLASIIVDALPVDKEDVIYATFTGKAAQVLANKGVQNVTTLHKLLYEFFPRPDGTFSRVIKVEINYHVVVVDEVSMAPKSLMDLLFSHGCYVICLGDPFQLPPINKEEDNHLLDEPHIFLDEIVRQAEDSEIIKLSMDIRHHVPIEYYNGKNVQVLDKEELTTGILQWADEILVGTNKTRIAINKQMRELSGFTKKEPQEGDKVICCRNYWETISQDYNSLINGTIGYLKNKYSQSYNIPQYLGGGQIKTTMAQFVTDNGDAFKTLSMDTHMIMTGDKCMTRQLAYKLSKNPRTRHMVPYEFTYGYAITVHKAQGSEWDNVVIIEESFPFDAEEHARWLYTAVTRASNKVVLLR